MPRPRPRPIPGSPLLWVSLVYLCGVVLRILYTLQIQRPEAILYADMGAYVGRAQRIAAGMPLMATDFQQAIGYPMLLAFLGPSGHSLGRAVNVQLVISCLVPIAVGLLGAAAYGRRTGLLAVVFASLYFPFIEYGALFLTEIHFILCLALAFAGFFAARRARRPGAAIAFAAGGGFALSLAITLKTTAMPAAFLFFVVDGVALALGRGNRDASPSWRARLRPWALRCAVVALAAAPVLGVLSRACTRANDRFCVTGKEMGSDFLLGHYGLVADIEWRAENGEMFRFGSPGALLRHYDIHAKVPFSIADGPANQAEAWRWIGAHPGEAIVLSIDHIYDTFFGSAMWPTINSGSWPYAHLSQYVFILLLLIPTLFAGARVIRRGARAALTSRTALVFAPVAALAFTVMIATGEVRYRIPFDIFFIAIACAWAVRDLDRVDAEQV